MTPTTIKLIIKGAKMDDKMFRVDSYRVVLQERTEEGSRRLGFLRCESEAGHYLDVKFLAEGEILPPNTVSLEDGGTFTGVHFTHTNFYPWYVDLLRNEKPVYVVIRGDNPALHTIACGPEPTGEEEG